jgi:hypothetical protein
MNVKFSQAENDEAPTERRKLAEGMGVIMEQQRCVQKAMDYRIRSFRYEDVQIETLDGQLLTAKMWVSDKEPNGIATKIQEVFKCDVCSKEFDKKQKLLLHARFHKVNKE